MAIFLMFEAYVGYRATAHALDGPTIIVAYLVCAIGVAAAYVAMRCYRLDGHWLTHEPRCERRASATSTGLALIVIALWAWPGLFGHDPWKPDEAYTFGLAYHFVKHDDWVIPTLAGEPFMEKPPLFFATAALFGRLFDGALPLHEAVRGATLLYVGVSLLFVYLAARKLYNRSAGVAAMLLLISSFGFVQPAHLLVTDNALVAGIAAAIYGLTQPERPLRAGLFLGTGMGFAFLSKGLIGPGIIAITALMLPISPAWRSRSYLKSLAIGAAALAPWFLVWPMLLYRESPQLFYEWLVLNNFGRYTGESHLGPEHDHLMYIKLLPWFALPAVPMAAWKTWSALRSRNAAELSCDWLPFAASCVTFGVLTSACNQRYVYAIPMLIPVALLGAGAAADLPSRLSSVLESGAIVLSVSIAAVTWALWWIVLKGQPMDIADAVLAARPGYRPHIDSTLAALAVLITVTAVVLFRAPRTSFDVPLRWATGVMLCWGLLMTLWLEYFDWGSSYRGVVAEISRKAANYRACVAERGLGEAQRAMIQYHAGILTRPEGGDAAAQCKVLVVQTGRTLEQPQVPKSWHLAWHGSRPGDLNEHFWVFRESDITLATRP